MNNISAFPTATLAQKTEGGMTLRDYFAAKAIQGILFEGLDESKTAKNAYAMADAMLKARESMTAAYFEDHPTDPEKVILRKKPRVEDDDDIQDYKKPWVGLTISERDECWRFSPTAEDAMEAVEAKLKEKNT